MVVIHMLLLVGKMAQSLSVSVFQSTNFIANNNPVANIQNTELMYGRRYLFESCTSAVSIFAMVFYLQIFSIFRVVTLT